MKKWMKKLFLVASSMVISSAVLPINQTVNAAEPTKITFWHGMGG
ncbi:hypothetical protein P7G58_04280 [Globicatella sulfidifaciens]|nr:hypothetical protein [Globicatella sulfidifaciens]MDT2768080.1 hypothetical protein [Globicatella sulfidifaciens]